MIAPTTRSIGTISIDRVRAGRELRQLAAAVGQDHRVGHLEALDPARVRALEGGLDDAGPVHRWSAGLGRDLLDDALAEGLGERVDVGPAEAAGALAAGPTFCCRAPRCGAAPRRRRRPRGDRPGRAASRPLRAAWLSIGAVRDCSSIRGVIAIPASCLGPPVDGVRRPAPPGSRRGGGRRCRRWRCARSAAGGRCRAGGLVDPLQQALDAEHVGRERLVDRRVEADVTGAVHDDVEIGRQRAVRRTGRPRPPRSGPRSAPRRRRTGCPRRRTA